MVNLHSLASRPGTRVNHIADTLYFTNSVKMMQIDWWVFYTFLLHDRLVVTIIH